ncbi:hypothetical protein [Leptothermofonsia sp. ETS-13]|uniref:hypothetical protein n=1 Tax=Leptothermofonsia sp. ETS-13 TaxID=3035696 RepID=UPI003BA2801D
MMIGSAVATALANALSGGAIGAAVGGLVGGLVGLGTPENRAQMYSDRVSRGEYLVMVEGSEDEIRQAESILNRRGIQNWDIFNTSASSTTTSRPSGST